MVSLPPLVEPADELTVDEVRRYSRHLIIPDVGMTGQKRLKNAKVLVVGAGGLGSSLFFAALYSHLLKVVPSSRMGRTMSLFYGALNVAIIAASTNVAVGFTVDFIALIEERTTASVWDFGDGIEVTNQPYTSHAWTALGDYAVVLHTYNESQPGGEAEDSPSGNPS